MTKFTELFATTSDFLPLPVWILMQRYKLMTPSDTGLNDLGAPL